MEEIKKEDLTAEEQAEAELMSKLALKGYVIMHNDVAQDLFRDAKLLHIIRDKLVDYDKAFGEAKTLLGFWINYDKEIEAWAKDILGQPKKTFLDDLPEVAETSSSAFEEAYDELNEAWEEVKE